MGEEELDECYECSGHGYDCFMNADGELECSCPTCPVFHSRMAWDDDDYWSD